LKALFPALIVLLFEIVQNAGTMMNQANEVTNIGDVLLPEGGPKVPNLVSE
jgi:hypothetical protein